MKLLLSNGSDSITINEFINNNKNEFYNSFQVGIIDENLKKQVINPFELILFEVVDNKKIIFYRLKRDNMFVDNIVYTDNR